MAVNCSFVTTVTVGMLQISVVPKVGLARINAIDVRQQQGDHMDRREIAAVAVPQ